MTETKEERDRRILDALQRGVDAGRKIYEAKMKCKTPEEAKKVERAMFEREFGVPMGDLDEPVPTFKVIKGKKGA